MQIIEAGIQSKEYWKHLWARRELLFFFTKRDIVIRYKQTIIGASWVLIRPFLTMVVFTVLFGSLANLSSSGLPYGFVVFAGMLPWFLFSTMVSDCSNSLVGNRGMLTKVYFPRLIFPLTNFLVTLVDFFVSFTLLIGMMVWYQIIPSWEIIFLPFFVLLAAILGLGIGLLTATLNVKYRDFQQIIPFLLQLGIYVSPVGYLNQLVPKRWEIIYFLNPMAGIINGFRWCLVPSALTLNWWGILYAAFFSFVSLYVGIKIFKRAEAQFADTI